MRRFAEAPASAHYPIGGPADHLADGDAGVAEEAVSKLAVVQERRGSFLAYEPGGFARDFAEFFADAPDAERFRTGDIQHKRRGGSMVQSLNGHCVSVG